jgi:hypothetical protein
MCARTNCQKNPRCFESILRQITNGIEIYHAFKFREEITELSFNITNGEKEALEQKAANARKREEQRQRLLNAAELENNARIKSLWSTEI